MNQYFYEAFEGLHRLSPGSNLTTTLVGRSIGQEEVNILDVGCGMGQSALLLAHQHPNARIIAIDNNPEYVRRLNKVAEEQGLSKQIKALVMSMEEMQFPLAQFDVIWAEGSLYFMGMEKAFTEWKKYLRPNGRILCNELCWLREYDRIPSHARDSVEAQFGKLMTVDEKKAQGEALGYFCVGQKIQPPDDWTDNYYIPLLENLRKMADKYPDNKEAREAIVLLGKEVALYSKCSPFYSYVMFGFENKLDA